MFMWLAQFLTAPIINGFLDAYKAKLEAANSTGAQAADVAKAAMLAEVEARKNAKEVTIAQLGTWYTAFPYVLTTLCGALYFAKCVVWDTMLGLGETPKLGGDIQMTYNLIMTTWFGGVAVKGAIVAARTWWR